MESLISMRSCALLNSFFFLNLLVDVYKSWINWISNFKLIWLTSQLLMQPSISIFEPYHVIFNPGMDMCLVIQARIWKFNERISMESLVDLWKQYRRSYYSWIGNWAQWTTTTHIIGNILCAKSCSYFEWSFCIPFSIQFNQIFELQSYPNDDID